MPHNAPPLYPPRWTRFASISGKEGSVDLGICTVKADEDFVEKGMYQFSRPMINAPDVEKRVLIVETVAPFRQVRERERERERERDERMI